MKNLFFILGLSLSLWAANTPHLFKSINQFIQEVIPANDQKDFDVYYQAELRVLRTYSEPKRKQLVNQMCRQGYAALEVKHPPLYEQLNAPEYTLCNGGKQEVKRMVMRLGFYENYCAAKAEANVNLFTRFKNYTKSITHSMSHWFGNEKKMRTT